MSSYFKNILAEVDYKPIRGYRAQKKKISYDVGSKTFTEDCFCYKTEGGIAQENPFLSNNKFWEEVKGLSFTFEDKAIKDFIFKYGAISPVITSIIDENIEPVEKLKLRLLYFTEVTNWVRWLKEERLEPLRENFKEDQKLFNSKLWDEPLQWSKYTTPENETIFFMRSYLMIGCPSKTRQLVSFGWEIVGKAIAKYLRNIPLIPVINRKNVFFCFDVSSALDAAFLQWYFQEFVDLRTCAAKGCENPVFSPRAIYCSKRCYQREKKRRYREKRK